MFGTEADAFVRFNSVVGLNTVDAISFPLINGAIYELLIETEDGSALNILGDNSGPSFLSFIQRNIWPYSEAPLGDTYALKSDLFPINLDANNKRTISLTKNE